MTGGQSQNSVGRYVGLALVLAAREFPGSYRGNATGALAAILIPVAMLGVYTFVFSSLIPVRFEGSIESIPEGAHYALFLFSGLIVWNLFSDVLSRGPRLFTGSPNYVHRPQFPISLLVLAPCVASLYRALPWLVVYLATYGYLVGDWAWICLGTPLVLAVACLFTFGATLLMASIGAVIRDLGDFIQPAVTLLFFLSPILYPAETIEAKAAWVVSLNPVAPLLGLMRTLAFEQAAPSSAVLVTVVVITLASLLIGGVAYRLIRDSLTDLI